MLETAIFLPDRDGPFACALLRTPYGIDDRVGDAERMAADGVAVVVQNVRGRFASDGDFDLGRSDPDDGRATVAWARRQPWCDGRVALWGFSYGGFTQWATLASGVDGVVAACPSMCPPPGRRLDFRRGGALEWAAMCHWLPRQAAIGGRAAAEEAGRLLQSAFEPPDVVGDDGEVDVGLALDHAMLGAAPQRSAWPGGDPVLAQVWATIFDEAPSDSTMELPTISTPCLIVGSWYDLWSEEPGEAFAAVRRASIDPAVAGAHRLVLAAAGHGFHPLTGIDLGPDADRFGLDLDHRWAMEWLTDTPGPLRSLAPVTWFLIGPNEWRSDDCWPPSGSQPLEVSLADGEGSTPLVADPSRPVPTRGGSGMLLEPGPRDQAGLAGHDRDDVASFEILTAGEGLVLAGPVVADLWVATDVPDADVAVKLVDVAPDGSASSVCDGITRLRWRDGGERAQPAEPGHPVAVQVRLGAVGYQVAAGHRLRVDVAGSNFPRYALNSHTGRPEGCDGAAEVRRASIEIHHAPTRTSTLTLTVLPGAAS